MDDLLSLLKASMQDQPKLVGAFSETDLTPFLSYISLGECAVRTPNEILVANEGGIKEQEVMDILGFPMKPQKSHDQGAAAQPSAGKPDSGSPAAAGQPAVSQAALKKVQNKKRVSLLGVHFSGTEGPMLFSDIEEFEISECTFENFQEGCFDIENCQHVSVRNCRFLNCSRPKKSQEVTHQMGLSGTSSLSEFLNSPHVSSPNALPRIQMTMRTHTTAGFSEEPNIWTLRLTAARPADLLRLCKALSHAKAAGGGAILAAE